LNYTRRPTRIVARFRVVRASTGSTHWALYRYD